MSYLRTLPDLGWQSCLYFLLKLRDFALTFKSSIPLGLSFKVLWDRDPIHSSMWRHWVISVPLTEKTMNQLIIKAPTSWLGGRLTLTLLTPPLRAVCPCATTKPASNTVWTFQPCCGLIKAVLKILVYLLSIGILELICWFLVKHSWGSDRNYCDSAD